MYQHQTQLRVRYAETDKMGFVYYGYYSYYYEVGRTEAIRALGVSYKSIEEKGILLPVLEMKAKYILPARYDDLLQISTEIREMPGRKISFYTEIQNEQAEILNIGETSLVFLDQSSRKLVRAPHELIDALEPYFKR